MLSVLFYSTNNECHLGTMYMSQKSNFDSIHCLYAQTYYCDCLYVNKRKNVY